MDSDPSPIAGLDAETVLRATAGDRDALGDIYRALNPALLRFLGSLGVREAEDVAGDVWADLARRMPQVEPDPVALRTLLFTIGRRRAIDARRRRERRPEAPVAELPIHASGAGRDALDAVDDRLAVLALLAQLPRAQAEVVALRFIVGMTPAEVGAVTGKRQGAVRVMTMRALRRLRDLAESAGLAVPGDVGEVGDVGDVDGDVTEGPGETMVQP